MVASEILRLARRGNSAVVAHPHTKNTHINPDQTIVSEAPKILSFTFP